MASMFNNKQLVPAAPSALQQMTRGDRGTFLSSDDNVMMKQIVATHTPDGREVDVRPLLQIVEDILNRATLNVDTVATVKEGGLEAVEDRTRQTGFTIMIEALSYTIDRLSCEISCKSLGGSDAHTTTVSLFNHLSSYSWDAKVVLALAAFALTYGEFWLLAQIYPSNQLAKSMAILKQLPTVMEHSGTLKPRFDALNNLIQAMLDLTRCIVEFKELPSTYISQDVPALATALAHVPTAVYWTVRSLVACAAQIAGFTSTSHELYIGATAEAWELSSLAHKINNIHEHLKKQLAICYQHIEEKKSVDTYNTLIGLFDMIHIDNMKILKALIYAKDDIHPLVDGATKRRVNLDVLRRKSVLLLISGLDISHDELAILEQIYNESRVHPTRMDNQFELVWIPIVDRSIQWTDAMQRQFETVQSTMPWYSVYHPSLIDRSVIRFIREKWHFRNKPILVVMDGQGRVLCPNAIHMMWIWGSAAFPFTSTKEEALWKDETWRLELLVDGIDPKILEWIQQKKYIFVYGGDDIEWIRRFTRAARATATAEGIPLEMVYVGKSTKNDQVHRAISIIGGEQLSYCWHDLTMIWFFWTRIQSMLYSKIQQGRADENDPVTQEIKKLLCYDRDGGWAVLSRGSDVIANGHGSTMLPTISEYDVWKRNIPAMGFDGAFRDHYKKLQGEGQPCYRFDFPFSIGRIPEHMKCPECLRMMEKLFSFKCCHNDEGVTTTTGLIST